MLENTFLQFDFNYDAMYFTFISFLILNTVYIYVIHANFLCHHFPAVRPSRGISMRRIVFLFYFIRSIKSFSIHHVTRLPPRYDKMQSNGARFLEYSAQDRNI